MVRHILAAAILLAPLGTAASGAEECKSELPAARTGHWSWRIVDGKRCWYRGHPGRDKTTLQWPRSRPLPAAIDTVSERELLESYWPVLNRDERRRKQVPFDERWPRR
jgi:hypothetical protein